MIERSLPYPHFNCGVRGNFSSFVLEKKGYSVPDDNCKLQSFQSLSKKTSQILSLIQLNSLPILF